MQHTLVAVFDNRSDAQNALDELVSSGFSRSDVNLSSADPSGETNRLTGSDENIEGVHEEGIGASIKHFFTGLFGSDHSEHASRYSDAVTSGRHVVTLTTQSEPEVERAADIVERFGPVDIDERHDLTAEQARSGAAASGALYAGAAGSSSGAAMGQSMQSGSLGSGSLGSQSGSLDTRPGALQTSASEDRSFFATQNINDPVPKDTTFQEPLGASMQAGGSLDSAVGGNTLSGTQSSSNNPSVSSQQGSLGSSQSGGLTQSGSTLQGTASIPGSDDLSLGGTALQSNGSLQGGSLSGSQQRDMSTTSGASTGSIAGSMSGSTAGQRSGVRVFSRSPDALGSDDDTLFRNDWDKNYSSLGGSYDDYAPAYRYGSESRSKYSGRDWNDVESDLRSDWDSRYNTSGEPSTWDKFKAAVRRGWDKITPDSTDDDTYYRDHFGATYGSAGASYDDYDPAYRYGADMRSSDKYRGRDWNDVESDLRSDWDSRYNKSGEPSTWEKFKAAVRHGWDKITPDMDDDDSYYRNHWSGSSYGAAGDTYNDYEPAYRYGNEMRSSDKYRGRDWNDVESDLHSDWDTRYAKGGVSTWDKMKAAVRHGWDRMTS